MGCERLKVREAWTQALKGQKTKLPLAVLRDYSKGKNNAQVFYKHLLTQPSPPGRLGCLASRSGGWGLVG